VSGARGASVAISSGPPARKRDAGGLECKGEAQGRETATSLRVTGENGR